MFPPASKFSVHMPADDFIFEERFGKNENDQFV
jgi:hypothetical protein